MLQQWCAQQVTIEEQLQLMLRTCMYGGLESDRERANRAGPAGQGGVAATV